jgi:Uma2 family endonuclease
MTQRTYKGLREDPAPRLEPAVGPIRDAPTEPDAFLRWAATPARGGRYELSRGRVTCTTINASNLHGRVINNINARLHNVLDVDRFDICTSDYAVQTPYGVRSPDLVVEHVRPRRALATSTPILIVEVLSPSTEDLDFTVKLQEYSAVEPLQTYLVCSQDEPRAWVWARQEDGSWPRQPMEMAGRDGAIALAGLDIALTMAAMFRRIPDTPSAG